MKRPAAEITIGENSFGFCTALDFSTSWKTLTDAGSLILPNKFIKENKPVFVGENNIFKKGDPITISAGYLPNMEQIFEGYITKVKPSIPVEISFEDPAFLLKQNNLTLSYENITLSELLFNCIEEAKKSADGYILEGLKKIKIEAIEANLGGFRLTNVNITQVLQELKKTYALRSFFRGFTLYVGLAYYGGGREEVFEFQRNIIEHDLEYLKEDETAIKVKAISIQADNTKIETEIGDPQGEQRTITKYNLTLEELKKAAEREIELLRYEGYRGKFSTFFEPFVTHGDIINIIDKKKPEKDGFYRVESVDYTLGVDGYFQDITLGIKVSV